MATLTNQELLKRVPLFRMLTPEQIEALEGELTKQRFKRNEPVVEVGKQGAALYMLLSGKARVVLCGDKGREVLLASLDVGDYIGEISLIDKMPHSASVIADSQLDVLVLSAHGFSRCVAASPLFAFSIMRGMAHDLRRANGQIASYALTSVYGRVAKALLETAETDPSGHLVVRSKLSHAGIARMVGASREMVSRAMKDFERRAFLERGEDGLIRINDRRSKTREEPEARAWDSFDAARQQAPQSAQLTH
jgi:CRP-like cAMP-binding protein